MHLVPSQFLYVILRKCCDSAVLTPSDVVVGGLRRGPNGPTAEQPGFVPTVVAFPLPAPHSSSCPAFPYALARIAGAQCVADTPPAPHCRGAPPRSAGLQRSTSLGRPPALHLAALPTPLRRSPPPPLGAARGREQRDPERLHLARARSTSLGCPPSFVALHRHRSGQHELGSSEIRSGRSSPVAPVAGAFPCCSPRHPHQIEASATTSSDADEIEHSDPAKESRLVEHRRRCGGRGCCCPVEASSCGTQEVVYESEPAEEERPTIFGNPSNIGVKQSPLKKFRRLRGSVRKSLLTLADTS